MDIINSVLNVYIYTTIAIIPKHFREVFQQQIIATTISCKAWNFPVEYPSWEYKFEIKESDGNMLNSVS